MDEFKKYLQQHRNQMDEDTPSGELLQRIHAASAPVKKASLLTIVFRFAAAACLLVFITIGARWIWPQKNVVIPGLVNQEKSDTPKISSNSLITDTGNGSTALTGIVIPRNETIAVTNDAVKKEWLPAQLLHSFSYNYTQLVNLELKNIRHTPVYGETGNYFNDFRYNLDQMDAAEIKIKSTIKKSGLNDILLEQLINVYQEKLELLKNLQHEINKLNNRVRENQLPTDSVQIHFINI